MEYLKHSKRGCQLKSPELWFVIPAYKAGEKIIRCLDSVIKQKQGNWKAIVAIDGGDDDTARYAIPLAESHKERIKVIVRTERQYALKNVVNAIKNIPSDAIVALLDGDDALTRDDVLEIILRPYEDPEVGAVWSQYQEYQNGKPFNHGNRTSGAMDDTKSPYRQPWSVSPLRTFRKSIFENIDERNFLDADGEYLKRAYDQAIMLPVVHLSRKTKFIPVTMYAYHNEPHDVAHSVGESCSAILRNRRFVGYPMDDVMVGILTYREGPFLENILKWLVNIVGHIVVLEDQTSMFGDQGTSDETKNVVNKVHEEMPWTRSVIQFHQKSFDGKGPAQESQRRTYLGKLAMSIGCDWVWHIDADEFYLEDEAKAMWEWIRPQMDGRNALVTCSMLTYWRSLHYRVDPPEKHRPVIISRADIAASLARQYPKWPTIDVPPEICRMRHYSWVRTPKDVNRKIHGWGHAHQMKRGWFEDVFMSWKPGAEMNNLHPTHPAAYGSIVRCEEDIPEALEGHPWTGLDIVENEEVRIKVAVLHHNMPENADGLCHQLKMAFDDVELIDCGSDPNNMPASLTVSLDNVYWEGAWLEAMRRWKNYDVVWILGGDIKLCQAPKEYRQAIEEAFPFGCWSPAIDGRAHPFMMFDKYYEERRRVKNIEGMALAVSGDLIRKIDGKFAVSTEIGFGQDYWLCAMARKHGLPNYIDGAVVVEHPSSIGYNEEYAHDKMDEAFGAEFGADYRRTLFEYDQSFEGNLYKEKDMSEKKLTIASVDNGWGVKEFNRITDKFKNECRRVIMRKGISDFSGETEAEVIDYDPELKEILAADVVVFTRVGAANVEDFEKIIAAGKNPVVNTNFAGDRIKHQETGFLYGHESWGEAWIREQIKAIKEKPIEQVRQEFIKEVAEEVADEIVDETNKGIKNGIEAVANELTNPVVSIITPTFRRDPRVVSRCIDCVRLQTVSRVEQLICSDGANEAPIASLVASVADTRISYQHTTVKKPGDFGNVVRQTMLEKAKGDYILFLDDDNLILPEYLAKMIKAIQDSGADFAVCKVVHFGPLKEDVTGPPPIILNGLPVKLHHVDPLQILVKREAMLDIGWDTEKGYLADGHTLQALGEKYKHIEVPEVLGFHM